MCRHLAYLGPPVGLDALVLEPPHSLAVQAHTPRHMPAERINADGFGVGWWAPDVRPLPAVYRTATPIWADQSFRSVAGVVRSGAVIAAVRNASTGSPVEATGNAPFASGAYLFSLNGAVDGFRAGRNVELRRNLPPERDAAILGAADSEVVFALVLAEIDRGAPPADALVAVLEKLRPGNEAALNLLLGDGRRVWATRRGNSLYVCTGDGSVIVASEPHDDDDGWREVPEGSLVTVDGTAVEVVAL